MSSFSDFQSNEDAETQTQRNSEICLGCLGEKQIGLVVCWKCFKTDGIRPGFKNFLGTFKEWLELGQEEIEESVKFDPDFLF